MLPCLAPMLLEVMMGYLTGDPVGGIEWGGGVEGGEEFTRNSVNPRRQDIGTSEDLASHLCGAEIT